MSGRTDEAAILHRITAEIGDLLGPMVERGHSSPGPEPQPPDRMTSEAVRYGRGPASRDAT